MYVLSICTAFPGCAAPQVSFFSPAKEDVLWPSPPEQARVRYLGEFAGTIHANRRRRGADAWNRLVFGSEQDAPQLMTPHSVAVDASGSQLAVADPNAKRVHILDLYDEAYYFVDSVGAGGDTLECPIGVAWLDSRLFIADAEKKRIAVVYRIDKGQKRGSFRAEWLTPDIFVRPSSLAADTRTGRLYICDSTAHAVRVIDSQGRFLFGFGTRGSLPGEFNYPSHVAVAHDGSIVIADSMNFRIQRFHPDGTFLGAFGRKGDAAGDFALPKGVAVDLDGKLWVVDAQFENVQAFDVEGRLLVSFGGEGRGPGMFWLPAGAAVDSRNRLWIADSYNRRIQAFEIIR